MDGRPAMTTLNDIPEFLSPGCHVAGVPFIKVMPNRMFPDDEEVYYAPNIPYNLYAGDVYLKISKKDDEKYYEWKVYLKKHMKDEFMSGGNMPTQMETAIQGVMFLIPLMMRRGIVY